MVKKAQSSIEFFILIGIASFFFVLFLFILEKNIAQKNSENFDFEVRELALTVQSEVALAHSANDGYTRYFDLPYNILSENYTISIVLSNDVYVLTEDEKHAIALNILNVAGQPKQGQNVIRNIKGNVSLN